MIQLLITKGTLTANAEHKDVNGTSLVTFSVAHNEYWKDKQGEKQTKVTFFKCQKWNGSPKLAETLTKGSVIGLVGTVEAKAYLNKQNEAVPELICIVREIDIISVKKNELDAIMESATAPADDDDLPF